MAIEYANILRSLNAMQESRARRQQADVDSALRGLQLAQQDKQFEQELAFKREQEVRAREQFEIEQQKFFINQATTLAEQNKVLMDEQASMVWDTVFRPFHDNYMKEFDADSKQIVYKGKKKHNNLIKALEEAYPNMTKQQATSIASMMGTVKIAGGKNTAVMDTLMKTWTAYTGQELGDAKAYREYKSRYDALINEVDQIQEGDYEFERSKYTGEVAGDEIIGDESPEIIEIDEEKAVKVLDNMDKNELMTYIANNNLNVEDVMLSDIGTKYNLASYRNELKTFDQLQQKNVPMNAQTMNEFYRHNLDIRKEELQKSISALSQLNQEHNYKLGLLKSEPTQAQIAAGTQFKYTPGQQSQYEVEALLLNMQIGMLKEEIDVNQSNLSTAITQATQAVIEKYPVLEQGF
jgi:hypothetical protein